MLVNQMLVALLLGIGDLRIPSTFLHDSFGAENGFLITIMAVDVGGIFDQVAVFDVSPSVTVTNLGNVPGGVVDGAGDELAELYELWHVGLLWFGNKGDLS